MDTKFLRCVNSRVIEEGLRVRNPAGDVTPAEVVAAMITKNGINDAAASQPRRRLELKAWKIIN
jgi:methylthioribose-1-phosphate isomerase